MNNTKTVSLITNSIFILLGAVIIWQADDALMSIVFIFGAGIALLGAHHLVAALVARKRGASERWPLIQGVLEIIIGLFLFLIRPIAVAILPVVWGLWIIYSGVVDLIELLTKNKQSRFRLLMLLYSGVRILFGGLIVLNPLTWGATVIAVLVGSYLIVHGIVGIVLSVFLDRR